MLDDPVSRYLAAIGQNTNTVYFENSGFILGRELQLDYLQIIFRIQNSSMLICDLKTKTPQLGMRNAVSEFIKLIWDIEQQVPEILTIYGMLRTIGTANEHRLRLKLISVLQNRGASAQKCGKDLWLVYTCKHNF